MLIGMSPVKRIVPNQCCGVIIDVQAYFLSQLDKRLRARIETNTASLVRLLGWLKIPVVATLERLVEEKGTLPRSIGKHLGGRTAIFEKDYFDLCKEKTIKSHLAGLKKKQIIVAGCETDVCVLQSCLGLLSLGYQVFVVEELLFSSARDVSSAVARMKAEGAVFVSYKTLYFELIEAVGGSAHAEKLWRKLGPFPDIPEQAV